MRFGVYVPTLGEYDVPTLAALAREAEGAGWDGFFMPSLWTRAHRGAYRPLGLKLIDTDTVEVGR